METTNFHISTRQRSEKAHFEKLYDGMQGRYILLIQTITKTITKTIGQDNHSLQKISSK